MDRIARDIYVLQDRIKRPIDYVQGGDAIPIIFTLRDFDIPKGAAARVYVEKPSGKAVYNTLASGKVSGNAVTVDVDKQMTAEAGKSEIQIELVQGGKSLLTFLYPIAVKRSLVPVDSENGSNFVDEYLKKIQEAIDRMEETREEIIEMAERGDFTASVAVGDTATLEAGQPAKVTNVGTAMDAIFNFAIPKGKTGATGPAGPQGIQGIQGPPGADGADGTGVVTTLEPGLFGVYISAEGHLILVHNTNEPVPPLKIVDDHLMYLVGGVE